MRPLAYLLPAAVLAAMLAACSAPSTSALAGDERIAGEVDATYVLRRVDGRLLPARAHVSAEGYTEFLADTLRFLPGGGVQARRVVRGVVTTRDYAHDRVFDDVLSRRYTRVGDAVTITPGGICDDGDALALCVPPDTGAFRGDSLIVALQMPGAPRRAYVRILR